MKKESKKVTIRTCLLLVLIACQTTFGMAQVYQKIHDFDGTNGDRSYNKLIGDATYLYGMTTFGGTSNKGTIYKIKPDGTGFQKLHDFNDTAGAKPYNSLTLIGSELFGVTHGGGASDQGVLFKINTDGTGFTKILDIVTYNGQHPNSSLYFDGTHLYGTTYGGGINAGGGMFYKVKPDGTDFTLLYSFNGSDPINGAQPHGDLLFDGTDFYGSLYTGGAQQVGTIFKIKPDGTGFQKLHDFDSTNVPDHFAVSSLGLLLHSGYLYGSTFLGGANGNGFVYKISTSGTGFGVLHDFETTTGIKSSCELVLAGNYLYGTTTGGSMSSGGVIFRIKPDGTDYSPVYTFTTASGYSPWCGLYYDNASLYGVTTGGGDNPNGTIFRFNDDNIPFSVDPYSQNSHLTLFPNPATTLLNMEVKENMTIKIVTLLGKIVATQQLYAGINSIDISGLTPGVYLLQTEKNGAVKFVKE